MHRWAVRDLHRYSIFGLVLESTAPMPELPPAKDDDATALRFSYASERRQKELLLPAGGPDHRFLISQRSHDGSTLLRFPGRADFYLDESFSSVLAAPRPQVSESLVRHLFLDSVVPLSLAGRGELVLHAGSVILGSTAVAVLGPSGGGKSTLVAALAQRGLHVLADDAVRIRETRDGWVVIPSYPGIRLWSDSIKWFNADPRELRPVADEFEKLRWAPPVGGSPRAWPALSQFVLLEKHLTGPPQIARSSQRSALVRVLEQSFYLSQTDRDKTARSFELLGQVIDQFPVWTLRYEQNYASLDLVVDAFLRAFGPQ